MFYGQKNVLTQHVVLLTELLWMHDKIVTRIITQVPISLVELSQVLDRSVVSSMTDNTAIEHKWWDRKEHC